MRSTFTVSLVIAALSIIGYRVLESRRDVILEHFLDATFNKFSCIKFADHTNKTSVPRIIYSNKPASESHCLTVRIMTRRGKKALSSLDEPSIIDAYIEGHLDIEWDSDQKILEKQAIELQQFMYYGNDRYSMGWMSNLMHLYNHFIAQRIQSYKISYNWIDQHYTDGDLIISSFVDDKYTLYSHGIGYGPTNLTKANDPSKVDCDTLSQDISLEQSAENKLSFVVENCDLKPGSNVLDVGSGWGAFGKYAVPRGINVRALTISTASVKRLNKVSSDLQKQDVNGTYGKLDVNFINFWELRDTALGKSLKGTLDAIVCLGTIEHLPKYAELMDAAMFYLKPGGYIHMDGFGSKKGYTTNYFIQKYIYPGDSAPFGASSFFKTWEATDLRLVYSHVDTENYANTLYGWAKKFERLIRDPSHPLSKISAQSKKIYSLYLWGFTMSFQHPTKRVNAWRVGLQKPLV